MFFAAITPLLPRYADDLDLSKAAAGVLSAAYAAGLVVFALPGGWIAARIGVRRALLMGLALLAASSLGFAFADSALLLDAARFLQGVGGALSWAAGLTWLAAATPRERRGEILGAAIAAAVLGMLLGPALGALAWTVGADFVFSGVAGVAIGLAAWTASVRAAAPAPRRANLGSVLRSLHRPLIALGIWLTALPSLFAGTLEVLAPLRLGELGASGVTIGAIFVVAAGAETAATWALGTLSDRRGRLAPIQIGLCILSLGAAALALSDTVALLAVLVVVAVIGFGFIWAPASTYLSEAGEEAGIELSFAFALFNLAWAAGQVLGGAGGAWLAGTTSDAVPYVVALGLCLGTLVVISRGRHGLTTLLARGRAE